MWTKKDLIYSSILFLLVMFCGYLYYSKANNNAVAKIAFVDIKEVFDSFQLKKELQKKLEKETTIRKSQLDSLMFDLQILSNKLNSETNPKKEDVDRFNGLQRLYYEQKQLFENDAVEMTQKYDGQILEQMSQYIDDYAKQHDYQLILGKNDAGNVMFGAKPFDISKEVIEYINGKYQGDF